MRDMTQLLYFRTVAQLEHITKAAEELHISQPNLSNAIKRLETSLGTELFERRNGRIFLNDYGKIYLEAVNQAFAVLESAENKIQLMQNADSREHIAIASTMQHYNENMLDSYLEQYPDTKIHVSQNVMALDTIFKLFWDDRLDIAFIPKTELPPILTWHECFSLRVAVMVSKEHPLAKKHVLSMQELSGEAFICNNLGISKDVICSYCEAVGFTPDFVFESNDSDIVGRWLESGRGIALVSSYDMMWPLSHARQLTAIPLVDSSPMLPMGIVKRIDWKENQSKQHFLNYAKQYFHELAEKIDAFWNDYFHLN